MVVTEKEIEQVRALIALAADARTGHHEASSAALQAARRIHKHDLLSLESLRAAKIAAEDAITIAREERARGEGAQGKSGVLVRVEVVLMVMSESPLAYNFARLTPDFRTAGSPLVGWIRKKYINQTIWASPAIAKTYSTSGRRIVEALIVPREVEGAVRKMVMA
jgi:hypothetical protein